MVVWEDLRQGWFKLYDQNGGSPGNLEQFEQEEKKILMLPARIYKISSSRFAILDIYARKTFPWLSFYTFTK